MNALRSLTIMISRIPPAYLVALILGVAAITAMLVTDSVGRSQRELDLQKQALKDKEDAMGTVVVALKDIPEGKAIASDMLEEKRLPIGKIPVDALTTPAMGMGRITKYGIGQGQLISQHDLAPIGVSLGFESRLKKGMRAVTFAVDSNSGVAGFVTPESRVDVLGMVGSGAETKVAPILADVEVIAVGQQFQKDPGGTQAAVPANSVTVAISPEDAQKLVKAVAASKLYLSLRSDGDHLPLLTVDVTSLYPAKATAGNAEQIASGTLPPPPVTVPEPIVPSEDPSFNPLEPGQAAQLTAPNSEIEMWSASARQVVTVPPVKH